MKHLFITFPIFASRSLAPVKKSLFVDHNTHRGTIGIRFQRMVMLLCMTALLLFSTAISITNVLVAFIAVFAVGACILTCFFSVNESRDVVTAASKIHAAGSVTGFMLFLLVPLLVAVLFFKDRNMPMGIMSIASFVLALVFFSLFVMSDKPGFKDTFVDHEGLWQRLNLLFMYLPLSVTACAGWCG